MANENYEGFDLTIYNLFTLLREMYYTRGETETNFLSKSGGTLGGSLTIQGNLTVQGNSYKIDTEDLVVKDYTITLAKDNEQALLSMVGMVVPKYDGTNYGFFGWDADGYAYVGDLTDYDGSSAITLAENTSLQKIATIKDTATGTTSDDIMVYDQTNKVFKKAPSGRYVIEDNELVASNDNNALYNLGAFDTISGNTITRQTGYKKASELTYGAYVNTYNLPLVWCRMPDDFIGTNLDQTNNMIANLTKADTSGDWNSLVANTWRQWNYVSGAVDVAFIFPSGTTEAQAKALLDNIYIQYKLATSYTEQVIENEPLLNLDSNGCNFLRNEWEKCRNLINKGNITISSTGYTITAGELRNYTFPAGTYTFSFNYSGSISGGTSELQIFSVASDTGIVTKQITHKVGLNSVTFTISETAYVRLHYGYAGTYTNFMINEGNYAMPYQPYYGDIVHKVDIEPVLLWENTNPNSSFANGTNVITTKDMNPYKYLIFKYKIYASSDFTAKSEKYENGGSNTTYHLYAVSYGTGTELRARFLTKTSNTTFSVSNCYFNTTIENTGIIPTAIYGTNVL